MSANTFGINDLMDLLCSKVGLPAHRRTESPATYFTDLGLDSLAFLQLQAELKRGYGVQMPDDLAHLYTVGDIVDTVSRHLRDRSAV